MGGLGGFNLVSRLLFPSPSSSYGHDDFPGELLWVPSLEASATKAPGEEDDRIPCLWLPYQSARFVLYYVHSNAEDLGKCRAFCQSLREQFQVHVFAVEYPGYGLCPGGPCDAAQATQSAFAGFRFVLEVLHWPLDSILVMGRSIGCGPALALATRHEVSGLILISPMSSFKELCRDLAGPFEHMVEERFPNRTLIQRVRSSVMIVHGLKDVVVPSRHGMELFKACRSRKMFVCPPDMSHNSNLLSDVSFLVLPMLQFFALPDYCFDDVEVPGWAFLGPARCRGAPSGGDTVQVSPRSLKWLMGSDVGPSPSNLASSVSEMLFGAPRAGEGTLKPADAPAVEAGEPHASPDKGQEEPEDLPLLLQSGMQPRVSQGGPASRSLLTAVQGRSVPLQAHPGHPGRPQALPRVAEDLAGPVVSRRTDPPRFNFLSEESSLDPPQLASEELGSLRSSRGSSSVGYPRELLAANSVDFMGPRDPPGEQGATGGPCYMRVPREGTEARSGAESEMDDLPEVPREHPLRLRFCDRLGPLTTEDCVEIVGEIEFQLLRASAGLTPRKRGEICSDFV